MPEQNETTFTKAEVFELMRSLIAESKKLNPLEERKLKEELEKESRRSRAMVELGKAEEFARTNKQNTCPHSRDDKGNFVPRGQGTWTTGGHVNTAGIGSLVCLRCSKSWRWRASAAEREYSDNQGLLSYAPPPDEYCLIQCVHCSKDFEQRQLKTHEEACEMKITPIAV